jgi:DNA polymerase-2
MLIAAYDPDAIIGWNVVDFDLRVCQPMCDEHPIGFPLGRGDTRAEWRRSGE